MTDDAQKAPERIWLQTVTEDYRYGWTWCWHEIEEGEDIEYVRADLSRREARAIVDEQAEDDGLWFVAETAAEDYLQRALRRLHEAIEGVSQEEAARTALEATGGPSDV